ncbi:uncharacterized protein LOC115733517 isoform X1 [Rhodamnia argentea]|uniref:Uncharacterized protein LOC115733517 isoform X1 n=1 Tax=Rhodamnia argentea TaxID=178133 RepID=A0ABM3HZ13_9MYRT|nr:uncharacterized protein LOC115733517 isoform X1 [Rhodamnia argentea]
MAVQEEDRPDIRDLPDEPWDWEEISRNLLYNIDQELGDERSPWGRKKHRLRWLGKPRAIPQVILKLQDHNFRESALQLLSSFLFEKREEDPENYYRAGLLLFHSCGTMAILIQEVLLIYRMMADGSLNERACMRLINVIILFQCIAANRETRQKLMSSCIVNFLVPLVPFISSLEVYDNVRAVALSVFGILCQARESSAVQWAIENEVVEVCLISMDTGNELTRVIGLHIVESILRVDFGISYIFSPAADHLLNKLMRTLDNLVNLIAVVHNFSPRILFHTIRCYARLCHDERGHNLVKQSLPESIIKGTFHGNLKLLLQFTRFYHSERIRTNGVKCFLELLHFGVQVLYCIM